jgi:hypothetical protein
VDEKASPAMPTTLLTSSLTSVPPAPSQAHADAAPTKSGSNVPRAAGPPTPPLPDCPPRLALHRQPRAIAALAVAALLLLALAGALDGQRAAQRLAESPQPLASLGAPLRSHTWDLAFWAAQRTGGSELWRDAVARCKRRPAAAFPNCTTVRLASWWRPQAAPPPPALLAGGEAQPAPITPVATTSAAPGVRR